MADPFEITQTGAIRIDNIYSVLGILPRANGYDLGYACTNQHGKTNMWARYKPEAIGGPAPLTEAQRKANNYGIKPSIDTAFGGVSDNAVNAKALSQVTFIYTPPSSTHWHRITDWAGYAHMVSAPHGAPDDVNVPFGTTSIDIGLSQHIQRYQGALALEDFSWATYADAPKYFTVIVFWEKSDGSAWYIIGRKSATEAIGADATSTSAYNVKIPATQLSGVVTPSGYKSQMRFFCCLCDHKYTDDEFTQTYAAQLYPLLSEEPPVANLTIQKTAAVSLVITHVGPKNAYNTTDTRVFPISNFQLQTVTRVTCWGAQGSTGMWLHGQFKNLTGTPVTLQRTSILFGYSQTLATTTATQRTTACSAMYTKSGSTWSSASSVTVPANGSIDVVFDVSNIPYLNEYGYSSQAIRDYVFLNMNIYQGTSSASTNAILGPASLYVADSTDVKMIILSNPLE